MTPFMIVSLTPLWMGLIALVVGLTAGRYFAKKERAEREARIAAEASKAQAINMLQSLYMPVVGAAGITYPAGAYVGAIFTPPSEYVVEGGTGKSQQTQTTPQPLPKLADAA